MKQQDNITIIKEKKYSRNNTLGVYILSITTVVVTYSMFMAQIHL
ncbi:MAG: hypothetical protein ACI849_001479 [Patiriisocius sp.]|jgi:hypothetical protein